MKKITTEHYEHVTYKTAVKLLNGGEDIFITPHRLNPESPWHFLFLVNKNMLDEKQTTLDIYIKSIVWYNCNSQTGKYPAYYKKIA